MADGLSINALETLRGVLRRLMNDAADHLAGGACQDFSEYKEMTGFIRGLAVAERELLDLNQRIEEA